MTEQFERRASIFEQAMKECHSSNIAGCTEWLADKVAELKEKLEIETAQRIYNLNKSIEWKEKHRGLEKENEMLKRHCMKFNPNKMIEFGAYVLYYSANPESKMDIPNCVYEKVEKMYADWNKRCENCIHGEERIKAIQGRMNNE